MIPTDWGELLFFAVVCQISLVGSLLVWEAAELLAAWLRRFDK